MVPSFTYCFGTICQFILLLTGTGFSSLLTLNVCFHSFSSLMLSPLHQMLTCEWLMINAGRWNSHLYVSRASCRHTLWLQIRYMVTRSQNPTTHSSVSWMIYYLPEFSSYTEFFFMQIGCCMFEIAAHQPAFRAAVSVHWDHLSKELWSWWTKELIFYLFTRTYLDSWRK